MELDAERLVFKLRVILKNDAELVQLVKNTVAAKAGGKIAQLLYKMIMVLEGKNA